MAEGAGIAAFVVLEGQLVLADIAGGEEAARGEVGAVIALVRGHGVAASDGGQLEVALALEFVLALLYGLVALLVVVLEHADVHHQLPRLLQRVVVHLLPLKHEQPVLYAYVPPPLPLQKSASSSSTLELTWNLVSWVSMILERVLSLISVPSFSKYSAMILLSFLMLFLSLE